MSSQKSRPAITRIVYSQPFADLSTVLNAIIIIWGISLLIVLGSIGNEKMENYNAIYTAEGKTQPDDMNMAGEWIVKAEYLPSTNWVELRTFDETDNEILTIPNGYTSDYGWGLAATEICEKDTSSVTVYFIKNGEKLDKLEILMSEIEGSWDGSWEGTAETETFKVEAYCNPDDGYTTVKIFGN